jgi:acetylglutamate kinase
MRKLIVIKIGGNIIDDEGKLTSFLQSFAKIEGKKILVHGGGKLATRVAEAMGIDQQIIDGRRITDAETLKVVTMVYAGYINKNIVAVLQANNCAAIGITGADGNLIQAHQRKNKEVDYGFVGDIDVINSKLLSGLLNDNFSVIVAPITHNKQGQLLNTNADTIAQEIAKAMSNFFEVHLIYSFEKAGVLKDVTDEDSVINEINPSNYIQLKEQNIIFEGMIPKLDNAFAALENGVKRIVIGNAEKLFELINGSSGTNIIHE